MSMLNLRRGEKQPTERQQSEPRIPRAPNVPAPAPSARPYSPEALSFAQKIIDDQVEIERLKLECDTWRSRALASEEQNKRLEMQLDRERGDFEHKLAITTEHHDREQAKLSAQRQHDVERLTDERDFYKLGYARTRERLTVAGKVILDTLEADKSEKPPPSKSIEQASLAAIEHAIVGDGPMGLDETTASDKTT